MTPQELRARTKAFAVETVKFVRTLPKDEASRVMAKQLIRCSGSVGANYRAACLAKSPADMISKLKIVEEEADECGFWLEVIQETETMPAEKVKNLHRESSEIFKIMAASILTLRKKL
jgi:four helix bundle protein